MPLVWACAGADWLSVCSGEVLTAVHIGHPFGTSGARGLPVRPMCIFVEGNVFAVMSPGSSSLIMAQLGEQSVACPVKSEGGSTGWRLWASGRH